MVKPLSDLPAVEPGAAFDAAVSKLAVVKLNGGLGTSMGCKGPKSVITVRDGLTFLDMTVLQVEYLASSSIDVPLVLMNSFNTDKDTKKVLAKYEGRSLTVKSFNQSQFPRLLKDTLQPAAVDYSTKVRVFTTTSIYFRAISPAFLGRTWHPRFGLYVY